MTNPIPVPDFVCPVCHKPIDLKNSKTDGNGKAIHEECYVRVISAKKPQPLASR